MQTTYTVTIDWAALHTAMAALDSARRSGYDRTFGFDGVVDALGGTYFSPHYESRGLVGLATLRESLSEITMDAWKFVHSSRREADADPWVAAHSRDERAIARARAAKRKWVYANVRAAVRVMLAARPVYDLLAAAGLLDSSRADSTILAGCNEHHIHLTGLRWLAGHPRDDGEVTLEQARAIAEGAPFSIITAERGMADVSLNAAT